MANDYLKNSFLNEEHDRRPAIQKEPSFLDEALAFSKEKLWNPAKTAASGIGNAFADAPQNLIDGFTENFTSKDGERSAGQTMIEGLNQSAVADLVDAGGIFAGKTPKHRRFVSPTNLKGKKDIAAIVEKLRAGDSELVEKLKSIMES